MVRGAWRCEVPAVPTSDPDGLPIDTGYCRRCGASVDPHPNDVCLRCGHLVEFHGRDTDGCGKMSSAGWCDCRRSFAREHADHARWA